jgi:hypothetical protein
MPEDDRSTRGGYLPVGRIADLDPGRRRIAVHAGESWYGAVRDGRFDFFTRLAAKAEQEGVERLLIRAERPASRRLLAQPGLHLLIGPRQPVGPHVLHVHPGYLYGFWYLDPEGVNYASSIGAQAFPGAGQPGAEAFLAGLAERLVGGNVSKAEQAPRRRLKPARAAVFLQEIEHYASPVHHIGTEAMLRAVARGVAGSGGGRVYVKLHPVQSDAGTEAVRAQAAGLPGVEITAASLHDIAAAADVVVTQNSAAGFEALLQRKPVVTCAASDFHHATLVARNPAQLKRALAAAPAHAAGFDFAGYLDWFLRGHLLESAAPEFPERAWARCLATGAL